MALSGPEAIRAAIAACHADGDDELQFIVERLIQQGWAMAPIETVAIARSDSQHFQREERLTNSQFREPTQDKQMARLMKQLEGLSPELRAALLMEDSE